LLKDTQTEARYKFKLASSLEKAREKKLFQKVTFYATPDVKHSKPFDLMKKVVKASGGEVGASCVVGVKCVANCAG
jgi:hypothetical protein